MGKLDFVYTTSGLEASFRVISKVPVKAILDWDFGDDIVIKSEMKTISLFILKIHYDHLVP